MHLRTNYTKLLLTLTTLMSGGHKGHREMYVTVLINKTKQFFDNKLNKNYNNKTSDKYKMNNNNNITHDNGITNNTTDNTYDDNNNNNYSNKRCGRLLKT